MKEIDEYSNREFIPTPYEFCKAIINRLIDLMYSFSFKERWKYISRNLVNIFGILSDIRLITDDEINEFKNLIYDKIPIIEKLFDNDNKIYTFFRLYFNKVDYFRIPKVDELNKQGFFEDKGIDLDYLIFFNHNPFVYKFYMAPLQNIGSWDIMYEPKQRNLEELTDLVYKLNEAMLSKNMDHEELYVVGGYVCLVNADKDETTDIDFFSKNDIYDVRRLAFDIGCQYDAAGWLSDLYSLVRYGYCSSLDELLSIDNSFYEYLSLSKLTLYVQTDKCILYTKLNSGRDKDILDIKSILTRLKLNTKEQILEYIKEYLSLSSAKLDLIDSTISKCLI